MANNRRLTALSVKFLNVTDNFKVRGVLYPSPKSLTNLSNLKWNQPTATPNNSIAIFSNIDGLSTTVRKTLDIVDFANKPGLLKINSSAGTTGQVFTSRGNSQAPYWADPSGGGGSIGAWTSSTNASLSPVSR